MFFLYANFQLSQKCHFYQLHWDTLFQECFWSRLINCCLFIKHYILNIDITRQLTFFRCFQLLEKEPRAETVLDIKEAIALHQRPCFLSGLWMGQTRGFGNGPSTLKIRFVSSKSLNRMFNKARVLPVLFPSDPRQRRVWSLICLKNSSSLSLTLFISQGYLTKVWIPPSYIRNTF